MARNISAHLGMLEQPRFRKKNFFLVTAAISFVLRNNHIVVITLLESTSEMKVTLHRKLSSALLTSAVIQHFNFLHGKEVVQYFFNYKCHRLHQHHFGKLLQSSIKENRYSGLSLSRLPSISNKMFGPLKFPPRTLHSLSLFRTSLSRTFPYIEQIFWSLELFSLSISNIYIFKFHFRIPE